MQQDQQQVQLIPPDQPTVEPDPIRDRVLKKKLSYWERFLRWIYSKPEWEAYLLEKVEKARVKGMIWKSILMNSF